MISEDQLEQLAVQWFQDTSWSYVNGTVISPEGEAPERDDFRTVVLKGSIGRCGDGCLNIEHRTPNTEHRSEDAGVGVESMNDIRLSKSKIPVCAAAGQDGCHGSKVRISIARTLFLETASSRQPG